MPSDAPATALKLISSMATRLVLAEGLAAWRAAGGAEVISEAVGGVDAARRVGEGEPFDCVLLAADAIQRLEAAGHVRSGSAVGIALSSVALAVRQGSAQPRLASEDDLKQALRGAERIGYSTGPSGNALLRMIERWGLADELKPRLVLAPPGVPVGSLVATAQADVAVQQRSELIHVPGIAVLADWPAAVAIDTVFTGAVCARAEHPDAARALLAFLASPALDAARQRQAMQRA